MPFMSQRHHLLTPAIPKVRFNETTAMQLTGFRRQIIEQMRGPIQSINVALLNAFNKTLTLFETYLKKKVSRYTQ